MLRIIHSCFLSVRHFSIKSETIPRVCVIGSGPAGWFTSRMLTVHNDKINVDIYEKLPTPFGLIRYGVSPDHAALKAVEKKYSKYASNPRIKYIGNVNVGTDISVEELLKAYHAVVFCYGLRNDRKLGIPGEEHIIPAPTVVGWYNSAPEYRNVKLGLDFEDVAVIGHGNVSLDISRILLRNIYELKESDISEHALEELNKSRVKQVTLIGRRGLQHVSFSAIEMRRLLKLSGFDVSFSLEAINSISPLIPTIGAGKQRLMQLLQETAEKAVIKPAEDKHLRIQCLRTPLEVTKNGNKFTLKLGINKLEGDGIDAVVNPTGEIESRDYGMIIRSIGYSGESIDPFVPFDTKNGIIPTNKEGRIDGKPGLYCSGWIRKGPIGVLVNTTDDSTKTARTICNDIKNNILPIHEERPGFELIGAELKIKGVQIVTFEDWLKIDDEELHRGALLGKPRDKISSVTEMLKIANLKTKDKYAADLDKIKN